VTLKLTGTQLKRTLAVALTAVSGVQKADILGARMTGGGFGGCTINLISGDDSRGFIEFMSDAYSRESGIVPDIYECRIGQGVYEIGPDE